MFRNFLINVGRLNFSRSFFETDDWVESTQCDYRDFGSVITEG